jgi:hypothetical protein
VDNEKNHLNTTCLRIANLSHLSAANTNWWNVNLNIHSVASLCISGMGFYAATLEGKRLSNDLAY